MGSVGSIGRQRYHSNHFQLLTHSLGYVCCWGSYPHWSGSGSLAGCAVCLKNSRKICLAITQIKARSTPLQVGIKRRISYSSSRSSQVAKMAFGLEFSVSYPARVL